ncbi:MAG: hypothetical protein ACRC2K_07890, partial [Clostridium sp.]
LKKVILKYVISSFEEVEGVFVEGEHLVLDAKKLGDLYINDKVNLNNFVVEEININKNEIEVRLKEISIHDFMEPEFIEDVEIVNEVYDGEL